MAFLNVLENVMTNYLRKIGQGPACVLLPGWAMPTAVMQPLAEQLAQRFTVYIVDLLATAMPPTLIALLAKQIPLQSYLVGWSLGGLVATQLALSYPDRVFKLHNICSTPYFLADKDWPGIPVRNYQQFVENIATYPGKTLQRFIIQMLSGQKSLAKNFIQQYFTDLPSISVLTAGLRWLGEVDLRKQMQHLSQPTQFIFAEDDSIVPQSSMTKLHSLMPTICTQSVVGNHIPFLIEPARMAQQIVDFFYDKS